MGDASPEGLPEGAVLDRVTPDFTESSVPPGLLRAHHVAKGVWGRLVVVEGDVGFVFEDTGDRHALGKGDSIVIPPGRRHHVEPGVSCVFHVEFHTVSED